MYVTRKELRCLKGSNWINNVVCFIYKIKYDFDHIVTPFIIFKHAYYSYMTNVYMYYRLSQHFVICFTKNKRPTMCILFLSFFLGENHTINVLTDFE